MKRNLKAGLIVHTDATFIKNLQMLTFLPPAVEVCEWVQRPEDRLQGKIFHLRKSEGHQLLKTQHVS